MFWAGIICNELVGPWKAPEGVKITSVAYIGSSKEHLEPWFGCIMVWLPFSPDLNPIENLWSIIKWKICFWTAIYNENGAVGCHIHNCEQHFSRGNSKT